MDVEVDEGRLVVRVGAISDDRCTAYLELRTGRTVTIHTDHPLDLSPHDVLLLDLETDQVEPAPRSLWPAQPLVGVVRLKDEERTVIDSNGRWVLLPTASSVEYRAGNTVQFDETTGVVRVLSESSISALDALSLDENSISKFRVSSLEESDLSFDDFGGLPEVIERARELIEIPLIHRDALAKIGARPIKGVLFTGLPGTGKTLLARIIAGLTDATFYEISGPEIFNKWVGQSEELIRLIFEDAARQHRAIVFFDELDSIATRRETDSHESSRRVVAQLLTALDGFKSDQNVIVIATTNRPQDIDPALRRPGRLDWEINFPLPNLSDREEILKVSSRHLLTSGPLPHAKIASLTESWSSAELAVIWTEAALIAVRDGRSSINSEDYYGGFERVQNQRAELHLSKDGQA